MHKTLGIVQVRTGGRGARLILQRKLGGMSLLERVVRRVTDCQRLDQVIVLSTSEHNETIRQLVPSDVPVFVGPEADAATGDPLAGFVAALDEFHAQSVVRVCADNPFVDPVLIDRLATTSDAHPECDYISYCAADGRPAILTQLGLVAEWCRGQALRRAAVEARRAADRQSVTRFLYAHPEKFTVRLIPLPPELDRDDLRLTIDFEEDWEHAQVIYEALGPGEWDWRHLADLLDHQPALRSRMAEMNRATAGV